MTEITTLWNTISPYVMTGLTILSNIAIVLGFAVSIKKLVAKSDIKANEDRIAKKVAEGISSVTLKQDIQPIVESKIAEIEEKALSKLTERLKAQDKRYDELLSIIDGLAKYFDNSRGVPDDVKESLKAKIYEAKNGISKAEEVLSEIVIEQPKKEVKKTENKVNIER